LTTEFMRKADLSLQPHGMSNNNEGLGDRRLGSFVDSAESASIPGV